ncbi:MAG: bifunctional nuclease family protein [Ignavibacteriales bacterium]|nr:bifunctional nuclease family protein [Ignavibacteriales bacterium]
MNKVECEILGLSSSASTGGAYALLLKEVYGNRRLPIIIGPPRPLTHDLLKILIENLGASLIEVVVTELKDNTFFAKIVLEVSSLSNEIDSRPSDAIALAIRMNAPIYVNDSVMDTASFLPSQEQPEFTEESQEHLDLPDTPPVTSSSKEAKLAALQEKLRLALEVEDYERAAKIRDEIQRFSGSN